MCSLLGVPGTAGGGARGAVLTGTDTTTRYSPPQRNKSNVSVVHSIPSGVALIAATSRPLRVSVNCSNVGQMKFLPRG